VCYANVTRFEEWAKIVGLTDAETKFEEQLQSDKLMYNLTMQALCHVCSTITRFNELTIKYGMQKSERARLNGIISRLSKVDDDDADTGNEIVVIPNFFDEKSKETFERILQMYQKRLSYMNKFFWGIKDKARFQDLVTQMQEMNNGLEMSLPRIKQSLFGRELVAGQPDNLSELRNIESTMVMSGRNTNYYNAAILKRRALEQAIQEMAFLKDLEPVDTEALLKSVALDPYSFQPAEHDAARVLRVEKGRVQVKVLIEYKTLHAPGDPEEQRTMRSQRLANLADLLRITPKPNEYRILDCKGIVRHDTGSVERYGLVFALPTRLAKEPQLRFSLLHDLLRTDRQNTVAKCFSLEQRFRLAARLANSVAYMHFAGWLHREIKSENVVCFHSEGQASIEEPFLSGFTFSRPDNPREVSEYDVSTASNLYRHADYQMPKPAQKFRRSYDVYGLGIVLIEIGLWKQIRAFWKPGMDAKSFHEHIMSDIVPLLGFYMGEKYRDAVMACLDVEKLGVGGDEGRTFSLAFSRIVVQLLERCET
jgi:hypothetical protein